MAAIGVIGSPSIVSRPRERYGAAWFALAMSDDLHEGLEAIAPIRAESGIETFYTFDVASLMRLTFSAQHIDFAFDGVDRSLLLGARVHVPFRGWRLLRCRAISRVRVASV